MYRKNLLTVVFISLIGFFVAVSNVNAQAPQLSTADNGCGVTGGETIHFNYPENLNDRKNPENTYISPKVRTEIGPLDITLPAGEYQVVLTSFDHHDSEDNEDQKQEFEQWYVQFEYDNGETVSSASIADLPEDRNWLENQTVNNALVLERNVVRISAVHQYPNHEEYQSVYPVCAGFKRIEAPKAAIGDLVWLDNNRNGLQDRQEPGLANVTVHLLDSNGAIVATQLTNGDGIYHFTELNAGAYSIQVVPPAEYQISPRNAGDDARDSDIDGNGRTEQTELEPGENDLSWDAGLFKDEMKSIEALVFCDANGNGIQENGEEGLANVPVYLYQDNIVTHEAITDSSGRAIFTVVFSGNYVVQIAIPENHQLVKKFTIMPVPENPQPDLHVFAVTGSCGYQSAQIGDLVWLDSNKNNVQDNGEAGVGGVTVVLLDANGSHVATTTTNSDGRYLFGDLQPGQYSLHFILDGKYEIVTQNVGSDDSRDSDINGNGRTALTQLDSGESDLTWDAGLFLPDYTACARFNLDLGRSAHTGAGVEGRYEMIEIGTGKLLATWDADFWWADSGWIEGIELSFAGGSWVEVYFYPYGSSPAQKLEIINPAPGTEYGWLAPGMCHAVEIEFPIDWIPPTGLTGDVDTNTVDPDPSAEQVEENVSETEIVVETTESADVESDLNEVNHKVKLSNNHEKPQVTKWMQSISQIVGLQ
ncbi:MAG: SdrD B-like domain-containing protein [Chloroflexota bacterium]